MAPDVSPADMEPAVASEPPVKEEAPQLAEAPPSQPEPATAAAAKGTSRRASSGRARTAPAWLQLHPACDESDLPAELLDAEKPRGVRQRGGAATRARGPQSRTAAPAAPAATEGAAHAPGGELPAGVGAAREGDVAASREAAAPSAPADTTAAAAAGEQAQPSDVPAPQAAALKAKPLRKRAAPKASPPADGPLSPPEAAAEGAPAPPPAKRSRKADRSAGGGAAVAAEAPHTEAAPAGAHAAEPQAAGAGDAMQAEPSGAPAPPQAGAVKPKRSRKRTTPAVPPPPAAAEGDAPPPPVKPKRLRKPDLRRNHKKKVVVPGGPQPGMAGNAPGGEASAPPQSTNGSGKRQRGGSRRPRATVSEAPGIAGGPRDSHQGGAAKRLRVELTDSVEAAAPTRRRRTGGKKAAAAAAAAEAAAAAAAAAAEKPVSGVVTVGYVYHKVAVLRSQDSPLGQADTDLPFLFRAAVTSTALKKPRSRHPAGPASPPPGRAAKPPRGKRAADMPAVPEDPDVAAAWTQLAHLLPATDVDQSPLAVVSSPAFISALTDFRRLLGAGMWDPHAVSGGGNARMGTHFGRLLSEPNIDIAQWCTQRPETGTRSRGRRGDGRGEEAHAAVPGNSCAPCCCASCGCGDARHRGCTCRRASCAMTCTHGTPKAWSVVCST